jgi:protein O-GlcNAc transferase
MSAELVRAALARRQKGDLNGAAALLEKAAKANAGLKTALGALQFERGNERLAAGDPSTAALAFQRAAALLPEDAPSAFNLGIAEDRCGRPGPAEAAYREALRRDPLLAPAWNSLLLRAKAAGRAGDLMRAGRSAIAADPAYYEALVNLGDALAPLGQIAVARRLLVRATALRAEPAPALIGLGLAEAMAGRIGPALAALRRALALTPAAAPAWNNLASAAPILAEVTEALRRALAIDPEDAATRSNLIFALAYDPQVDGATRLAEARRWAARHAPAPRRVKFGHVRDPERRLRLGYLSADLRQHPVAYNVEDLFRCHDRAGFEVVAYSATATPDTVTQRIAGVVDGWRDIAGRGDADIAEMVRADRIDVLVVLAGHAGGNPLAVAGLRPAPVQVSFHDVSTSGLDAVDGWISDSILHPEDTPERFTERLMRLPCFYLQRPPEDAPEPALRERPPVFGSFNNPLKLVPAVLDLWAKVLDATPGARLLLKYKNRFSDPLLQSTVRAALGERVDFLSGDVGRAEQLALLNRIDVALDPFPFNGSTTSFEALWMGVPVVTLAGDRFVGRVGASLLHQVGLDDLVALDAEAYVATASALARDRTRLATLRQALRPRLRLSPLCDAPAHARNVEQVYRRLWRDWCAAS